jgi:hypothetical protein
LPALEQHFKHIFLLENGKAEFVYDGQALILNVTECPAIKHLLSSGQLFTNRYCETTVNVNKAICEAAGYDCRCTYELGVGKCVQKFWKKEISR